MGQERTSMKAEDVSESLAKKFREMSFIEEEHSQDFSKGKRSTDWPKTVFEQKELQLQALGVRPADLSTSAKTEIEIIVGVTQMLGLNTTQMPAALSRIIDMRAGAFALQEKEREAESILAQLRDQKDVVQRNSETLTGIQQSFDETKPQRAERMLQERRSAEQSSLRANNYREELVELKKDLKLRGFQPALQHSHLMRRANRILAQQQETEQLVVRLNFFKDLPPNLEAAKEMYHQKYEELQRVNAEFDGLLSRC